MPTPAEIAAIARSLRPAHAVASLPRGSPLLLMNPRDLRRASQAPLVRLTVPISYAVPGILRAARDAKVIVGLVKAGSASGEGPPPPQFTVGTLHAADELHLATPFFLATPPLQLGPDLGGERTAAELQRWIDAGFTEIVARAQSLSSLAGPKALEVIREREIPVCLSAEDPARLREALASLPPGVEVDLVKLWSAPDSVDEVLGDTPGGRLELPYPRPEVQQLKGLDLSVLVMEVAERVLGAAPAARFSWDVDQIPEETVERLEALVYTRLMDAFEDLGLVGMATQTLDALAANPGY